MFLYFYDNVFQFSYLAEILHIWWYHEKIMYYQQFQLYLLLAITSSGTPVMKESSFFHSDLKFVLVVVVTTSLDRFTFFLLGLSDLDDSAIFIFLSIFQKICKCLKMLFQKVKPIISPCFLYIKKNNYREIIKMNITKLFI